MLSVLIPSYGYGRYIRQAVLSALDTSAPVEVIVLDGGSGDETQEVLASINDPRLTWVSEPDRGQSHALNKALARAEGGVIGWLNADEYYLPGTIDRICALWSASSQVVYGDKVMGSDSTLDSRLVASHRFSKAVLYGYGPYIPSCAAFMERSLLQRIGGWDESFHRIMDWDLWIRLNRAGADFLYLPEVWGYFRLHPDQVTASAGGDARAEHDRLRKKHGLPPQGSVRQSLLQVRGRVIHASLKAREGGYRRQREFRRDRY